MTSTNSAFFRSHPKGSVAGFVAGKDGDNNNNDNSNNNNNIIDNSDSPSTIEKDQIDSSEHWNTDPNRGSQIDHLKKNSANNAISTSFSSSSQTQPHSNPNNMTTTPATSSGKPCHASRLSLLCCQNAIRMGARTQLGLCPPGRARRELKAILRQRNRSSTTTMTAVSVIIATSTRRNSSQSTVAAATLDTGGYFGVDKMIGSDLLESIYPAQEEELLTNVNALNEESDEEASSGDDDDLIDPKELLLITDNNNNSSSNINSSQRSVIGSTENKYANLMEPLFAPICDESGLSNSTNGPMSVSAGGGVISKLPFNRRKIRYFDSIAAQDTATARAYLQSETKRCKQREVSLLVTHLKRSQRIQRKQLKQKRGKSLSTNELNNDNDDDDLDNEFAISCVSRFDQPMTPGVAAALVIESLGINTLESIDGMAKCYDGIIAAGIALLEINNNITTSDLSSPSNDTSLNSRDSGSSRGKRSQIMAALTPLLISSLEQPSGDVIISLAKMRHMCGTPRYQRRFVQRVAPSLIRPPNGAMWCLRHQSDMEPILAAAELIFDSAHDVFSKGWYDRGQSLLADTKRAETLNTVAMQLKNLSHSNPGGHLKLELNHGTHWRTNKYKVGIDSSKGGAKEPLSEWEVIAVDRQIRTSISNIISMDWSRVVVSKEAALSSASLHRSRQTGKSRSSALLQSASNGDANMSPKAHGSILLSPMSPSRRQNSEPQQQYASSADGGEIEINDVGDHNFSSHYKPSNTDMSRERTKSPILIGSNPPMPLSPPPPNRSGAAEGLDARLPVDTQFIQASSNLFPSSEQTPPRSPTTPKHKEFAPDVASTSLIPTISQVPLTPMSPKRNKNLLYGNFNTSQNTKDSISTNATDSISSLSPTTPHFGGDNRAPLSPQSIGTGLSPSDGVPHRPISSASSVSSGISGISGTGSQPSHYRMLTSTAAERKRTVAACRALRAQITRFEEAFVQLHGRPPKGAAERAPLATTYAQYREWKRAIRADAACRIQALFRGASKRWMLLLSGEPNIAKIVRGRAARRSFSSSNDVKLNSCGEQNSIIEELSIPSEIGDNRQEGVLSTNARVMNLDVHMQGSSHTLTPQWGDQIHRRMSGSSDYNNNTTIPRPSSPIISTNMRTLGDLNSLSLPELQARKRELKQQLKQYDMSFARRHGRMPVKAEKEPIRHLYERYNTLKTHIGEIEHDGRRSSSRTAVQNNPGVLFNQRPAVSPVGSDSEESIGRRSNTVVRRISPSSSSVPISSPQAPAQDLATLKAEKGRLHQMLRSFERDFFRENQRQVQSFADIRPVASQYRRYKEIKRAITALQRER